MQGAQADSAYARLQREQQESREKVVNAARNMRKYGFPQYADAVENGGLDINSAWNGVLKAMSPGGGAAPTDDMLEYSHAVTGGFEGSFSDWMGKGPQATPRPLSAQERAQWGIPAEDSRPYALVDGMPKIIGGSGVTVNNNLGEDSFASGVGSGMASSVMEQRGVASDAVQSLRATQEARALLDAGMITGFGADWAVNFGKALQQAGINIDNDALANSQAFVASRAQEVGRMIKMFGAGTGLSDADRQYAEQAAAGQITMTEDAIRKILEINERASRNAIESYNSTVQGIDPGTVPVPLTIDLPAGGNDPLGIL